MIAKRDEEILSLKAKLAQLELEKDYEESNGITDWDSLYVGDGPSFILCENSPPTHAVISTKGTGPVSEEELEDQHIAAREKFGYVAGDDDGYGFDERTSHE